MEYMDLLVELHKDAERQGPGGDAQTLQAASLARLDRSLPLKIADIGCGTGAASLVLAKHFNVEVTAVDFLEEFLSVLEKRAASECVGDRINVSHQSMDDLDFEDESYDVLWSEGAIYSMGFEEGIKAWARYLKPKGMLVVSEITWLTNERPAPLNEYWEAAYPQVATASEKMRVLENNSYKPLGYVALPSNCWLENYYRPLQSRFDVFLSKHSGNDAALQIIEDERNEIALYEMYKEFYSYGMYVAQKC